MIVRVVRLAARAPVPVCVRRAGPWRRMPTTRSHVHSSLGRGPYSRDCRAMLDGGGAFGLIAGDPERLRNHGFALHGYGTDRTERPCASPECAHVSHEPLWLARPLGDKPPEFDANPLRDPHGDACRSSAILSRDTGQSVIFADNSVICIYLPRLFEHTGVCTVTRSHAILMVHWLSLAGALKQESSVASVTTGNATGVKFIPRAM